MKLPEQPLHWRRYKGQSAFKTYIGLYQGYYLWSFIILLIDIIKLSPVFIIPIITANLINHISEEPLGTTADLIKETVIGLLFIIQNIPTHVLYASMLSAMNRKIEFNLRTTLCIRLQHLSMNFHHTHKTGYLQTKILRDVENIEQLTQMLFDNLPTIFCNVLVAIIMTAIRAPSFLIFFCILVPLARAFHLIMKKRMEIRNKDFRVSMEHTNSYVNEMLRMLPLTRAHNTEDAELKKMQEYLDNIKRNGYKLDNLNALFGSISWTNIMCFNLITLGLACYLKLTGAIKIGTGDIVMLTTYFNILSGSVMGILNMMPGITRGLESVKSIGEVLECKDLELNEGKDVVDHVRGDFKFENVSFQYSEGEEWQIQDFSFHVKPGETIALVGASGAGKSTLVQLVIGFIRPQKGRILLDDVDMNTMDLRTYRSFISVVSQETVLFDGSIRDNIAYGMPNATEEQILEAVKEANLSKLLSELPDGMNTRLYENGSRLSGGQRQRIAIARALLRNPQVLILDEATSALDIDSEMEIRKELDELMKNRTTFVVAHRLSTIHNADHIIVMDKGTVAEVGNHATLLAQNGKYAEMYRKYTEQ